MNVVEAEKNTNTLVQNTEGSRNRPSCTYVKAIVVHIRNKYYGCEKCNLTKNEQSMLLAK